MGLFFPVLLLLLRPILCPEPSAGGASAALIPVVRLSLDVSPNGSFGVLVGGERWLEAAAPAVHINGAWWTKVYGPPTSNSGSDGIGPWTSETFRLRSGGSSSGAPASNEVEATFRTYGGGASIVFSLHFPGGASGTRTTSSDTACQNCKWPTAANNYSGCLGTGQGTQCFIEPATRFPSFSLGGGLLPQLGFKTWEFTFGVDHSSGHSSSTGAATNAPFGQTVRRNGNPDIDPAGGAPVVLFRDFNTSSIVVGPLNNFMTAVGSVAGGEEWVIGTGGEIDSLPPGYTFETLLHVSGSGITDAMLGWGAALRRFHNTTRNIEDDIGLQKLGYWTDNGAYFMLFDWQFGYPSLYPAVKPTSSQFPSAGGMAARALILMHNYFRDIGVPVSYLLHAPMIRTVIRTGMRVSCSAVRLIEIDLHR